MSLGPKTATLLISGTLALSGLISIFASTSNAFTERFTVRSSRKEAPSCQSTGGERQSIAGALVRVNQLPDQPLLDRLNQTLKPINSAGASVFSKSSEVLAVFNRINSTEWAAGRFILLSSVEVPTAQLNFIDGRLAVILNPSFLSGLKRHLPASSFLDALAFVISHEMSHFFYERYILEFGASPLCQLSYGPASVSPEYSTRERESIHAEVDLFGAYLAQAAGFNPVTALLTLYSMRNRCPSSECREGYDVRIDLLKRLLP